MTTQFNGIEFNSVEAHSFAPTFEGAGAKKEFTTSLTYRRDLRRMRRANRAL